MSYNGSSSVAFVEGLKCTLRVETFAKIIFCEEKKIANLRHVRNIKNFAKGKFFTFIPWKNLWMIKQG